uniref:Photosystem II reaction center protein Z n=1 Tax=Rhipiliopsis peltata TaxID=2320810 RepID=A0A386B1F7_9CHLO|nr:photosystem II protein Z [Rhipiliopsis peltata]AYC65520.1 photosystem II protein Z [Rhipiliopsis peltata]
MNLLFQVTVFSFVAFSSLLMIGVPIAGITNVSWNKTTLLTGIGVWFLLVFIVGAMSSFVV